MNTGFKIASIFVAITLCIKAQAVEAELDITALTILQINQAMDEGRFSSVDLVEHYLARINAFDQQGPVLNTIIYM